MKATLRLWKECLLLATSSILRPCGLILSPQILCRISNSESWTLLCKHGLLVSLWTLRFLPKVRHVRSVKWKVKVNTCVTLTCPDAVEYCQFWNASLCCCRTSHPKRADLTNFYPNRAKRRFWPSQFGCKSPKTLLIPIMSNSDISYASALKKAVLH